MPRIDPKQLLQTLGVLLAPNGGIKSSDEVVRIVTLMQKFSKKLVSKCIYVQILKSTEQSLLERFLDESGWDLLNSWFLDAVKTANWPFSLEMIELFAHCPMSADRLKGNTEQNQAPKLINQLRNNSVADSMLRKMASDLYDKWVKLISPSGGNRINRKGSLDSEGSAEDLRSDAEEPKTNGGANGPISLLQSLADEVSESIKKEEKKSEHKSSHNKKDHNKNHHNSSSSNRHHSSSDKKHQHSSSSKSSSNNKEREREKEKERERDDRRKRREERDREKDRERKRYRPDRRDEVDPSEKQRIKEIARKMKEEEQAKKDKDTLSKLGGGSSSSMSRIPKIPKKAVDDNKNKGGGSLKTFEDMLGGLDSKPKTVKTPMNKNKTASLLEGLKSSSSSSKSSSSSSSRHHHHHHHHSSSSSSLHRRDSKENLKSFSSMITPSSKSNNSTAATTSSPSDSPSNHIKKSDSTGDLKKPSLSIPEAGSLKKRKDSDAESPSGKSGKSPNISDSSSFMDAIFSSMSSDQPRKKKRRLSDNLKDESGKKGSSSNNNSASESPNSKIKTEVKKEEPAPAFSFYRDTLDTPEEEKEVKVEHPPSKRIKNREEIENSDQEDSESDNQNEINAAVEPKTEINKDEDDLILSNESKPREVKGILVYHRGLEKRNRRITWKPEANLVSTKFFELDEDERVNVNKIKFENMRDMELKMEKAFVKAKNPLEDKEPSQWYKPVKIDLDGEKSEVSHGCNSKEKEIQFAREKNVLQALYFNRESTPSTPAEPDQETHPRSEPMLIPLEDQSGEEVDEEELNYSNKGWPEPKRNQVDQQASLDQSFSLPPSLSAFLSNTNFQNILPPAATLSQEDQNTLAAQTKAMLALGILPDTVQEPPPVTTSSFPPPIVQPTAVMVPPPGPMPEPFMNPPHFNGNFPPPGIPPPGFNGPPPMGGPPMPPHLNVFGGGPDFNSFRNQRGGGGGPPMRGGHFQDNRGRGGNFRGAGGPPNFHNRDRDFNRGIEHKLKTKPCLYYQNGFCRDGDFCRFIHDGEQQHHNNSPQHQAAQQIA